jgi:hypothetical protein
VINPDAAANLVEGSVVDGIGNALYGGISFKDGVPDKKNFNSYRMIRISEAPKSMTSILYKMTWIRVVWVSPHFHRFLEHWQMHCTRATGKRFYEQPFITQLNSSSGA